MIKPSDPNIRVGIEMPASVYQRLSEHARERKVSLSRLCRDGALRELERLLLEERLAR
jgi:hypothetical protein